MRIYAIRILVVILVILAVLLAAAAISLHQMYPMRVTGSESEGERRWIQGEKDRRKAQVVREELELLAAGGVDVSVIILLVAYARKRSLSSA